MAREIEAMQETEAAFVRRWGPLRLDRDSPRNLGRLLASQGLSAPPDLRGRGEARGSKALERALDLRHPVHGWAYGWTDHSVLLGRGRRPLLLVSHPYGRFHEFDDFKDAMIGAIVPPGLHLEINRPEDSFYGCGTCQIRIADPSAVPGGPADATDPAGGRAAGELGVP